jgi:hypothetical protein
MDGSDMNEKVMCCFCGKQIDIKIAVLLQVFPYDNKDESQQLYCHRMCFVNKLHKNIPKHPDLLGDDY